MQRGTAAVAALRTAAAASRLCRFTGSKNTPAALFASSNRRISTGNTDSRNNSSWSANAVPPTTGAAAASFLPLLPPATVATARGPSAAAFRSLFERPEQPHLLHSKASLASSSSAAAAAAAAALGDPGLLVTKTAPDFTADAVFPNGELGKVSLSEYRKEKKGVVLLFYPLDFTFVCPSELLAFHHAAAEFEKLRFQVVGVSVDSVYTHLAWTRTSPADGGVGRLSFPLVSDLKREISSSFHVLLGSAGVALRGLFIIDRDGVIKHSTVNDLPLGRSVDEALRVCEMVQALEQQKDAAGEGGSSLLQQVCPANWRRGQKMMHATYEGVKEYLAEKEREIKQKVAEKL